MNIKIVCVIMAFCLISSTVWAAEENASATGVTQQLEGFNLNGYTNDGKKSWEVNGAKADIGDEKINVDQVDANFYGKQNGNLKADKGIIDKVNGAVNLQDNVVVTSERGTTMKTDSLDWDRNKDLVTTKDKVKIEDVQGVITGTGLKAQPNLKKAQLNEDVKAVINTSSSSPKGSTAASAKQTVTITSDGPMQMDQVKMYAVFNKNVVAVEAATGRELNADKMEVWFDEKNKRIKKLICSGNVKVVQGESASYAEEMVYEGDSQVLTMLGRPKIVFDTGDTAGSGMFQQLGK